VSDLPPLPPELDALVRAEANAPAGHPALKDAIRARVLSAVAGPPGGSGGATGGGGLVSAKGAVALALVIAGGTALLWPKPEPSTKPSPSAPAPVLSSQPIAPPAQAATPAPASQEVPAPTLAVKKAVVPAPPSEETLLRRAWSALARNDAHAARAALLEHERIYPQGDLAEERDALLIKALLALGDSSAARARASAFLESYPTSIHRTQAREAVSQEPP
jgi:TolA-binding protein